MKGAGLGTRLSTTDGRNVHFCGYGAKDFKTFSQWYLDVPDVNQAVSSTLIVTLDEACDDGNSRNHDGCSAACALETIK